MLVQLMVLLGILGALQRVSRTSGRRLGSLLLLYVSLVATVTGVLASDFGTGSEPFSISVACYIVGYLSLGGAALHPSAEALMHPAGARRNGTTRLRLGLLGGSMALIPVVGGIPQLFGRSADGLLQTLGPLIMVPLVLTRIGQLIGQRTRAEQDLAYQATHDDLTGLVNRRHLFAVVAQARAARRGGPPSPDVVLYCDLDDFKPVNDRYGHEAGDEVLRRAAQRLVSTLRDQDVVARIGGDEFLAYCPGADEATAELLRGRVEEALRAPIPWRGHELRVSVSVGTACDDGRYTGPGRTLRRGGPRHVRPQTRPQANLTRTRLTGRGDLSPAGGTGRDAAVKPIVRAVVAGGLVVALGACSSGEAVAPRVTVSASGAVEVPALADTVVRPLAGNGGAPFDRERRVQAPPGWTVSVWARVPGARLLAWTPDGRLLVSRPKFGDVVRLVPGRDGEAPAQGTLVGGLNQPHGLAFAGSTLHVAESSQVDAFAYDAGAVSGRRIVAGGLPDDKSPELGGAYAHALKSVAVGRDGALYVSVGSTGNVSAEDRDARPERASILRVPPGGGPPAVFARGVRNGTGLAVDPDGGVWTAVNNRDNIGYPYDGSDRGKVLRAYVNDHPLEPLARLEQGRDLGWPFCNPDPDLRPGEEDSPLSYTGRPFVRDVQTNPGGEKLDCAALPPVEQGMGAHSAPLGLSFAVAPGLPGGYGPGALVGIHGSWNRTPPRPPEVSFFAWRDGTLGPQQTLLTGFQAPDGTRWGRPVMAVQGPDRALYVSDDLAGAVYRVAGSG
ncbi:diguanylate cyclase (GGDEF)-like protein [Pseudosporangium ferrugineum]|uniref:Diguanylate cyclase (GGDEF)-like protein n=1 Tax=Pseudosporangium ferrugineum TaxID=439699 RepID=A0A2T0SFG8_9ACTN|nr:diguanylate cyclase (GGDEF)-like protein [Pseudosporangium ferrugineum]